MCRNNNGVITDISVSKSKCFQVPEDDDEEEGRETGTVFNDVDLTEKEWADFDEKSNESTCISEFEINFIKLK